jgi:hypothetical protein
MNESASFGLDSDIGFMNCLGMCTLAHECLVGNVPHGRLQVCGLLDQQCQQHWAKTSVREKRCSRHENQTDSDVTLGWFQHRASHHLCQSYLSCLEWDISAQHFPSHWEVDSCAIGEWW